jgi:GTPase SAR1 family protein
VNILLLGESGTGKTTFINALANYLVYNTLDEATAGKMQVLIPASFSITDPQTYDSKNIYVGQPDPNENNDEVGESRTRGCKTYVFTINSIKLRIIDAPGVSEALTRMQKTSIIFWHISVNTLISMVSASY